MTRTVKHPDERRAEIISAARELFQVKDYDKSTMQELLKAAAVDIVDNELKHKDTLLKSDKVKHLSARLLYAANNK